MDIVLEYAVMSDIYDVMTGPEYNATPATEGLFKQESFISLVIKNLKKFVDSMMKSLSALALFFHNIIQINVNQKEEAAAAKKKTKEDQKVDIEKCIMKFIGPLDEGLRKTVHYMSESTQLFNKFNAGLKARWKLGGKFNDSKYKEDHGRIDAINEALNDIKEDTEESRSKMVDAVNDYAKQNNISVDANSEVNKFVADKLGKQLESAINFEINNLKTIRKALETFNGHSDKANDIAQDFLPTAKKISKFGSHNVNNDKSGSFDDIKQVLDKLKAMTSSFYVILNKYISQKTSSKLQSLSA